MASSPPSRDVAWVGAPGSLFMGCSIRQASEDLNYYYESGPCVLSRRPALPLDRCLSGGARARRLRRAGGGELLLQALVIGEQTRPSRPYRSGVVALPGFLVLVTQPD